MNRGCRERVASCFANSLRLVCCLLALFWALQPAFAAAEVHAEPQKAEKESTPHKAGDEPPQEGPITAHKQDVDLAVWSLITFAVFVFVLGKFAWGPITEGLEKREQGILQHISDAEAARIKAEKLLADHTEKLDRVQDQVREMLAEARRDAESTKAEIIATAQKEAEATKTRAVAEIQQARDTALNDLFDHMSKVVAQATESVIGRTMTGPDQDRLIQDALHGIQPSRN